MRPQDPRQRMQRNRAIAVQLVMIVAGAGVGTWFLVKAISGDPLQRGFHIMATCGCFGVAAFYIWLVIRRRRREEQIRRALAERQKKAGGQGRR